MGSRVGGSCLPRRGVAGAGAGRCVRGCRHRGSMKPGHTIAPPRARARGRDLRRKASPIQPTRSQSTSARGDGEMTRASRRFRRSEASNRRRRRRRRIVSRGADRACPARCRPRPSHRHPAQRHYRLRLSWKKERRCSYPFARDRFTSPF